MVLRLNLIAAVGCLWAGAARAACPATPDQVADEATRAAQAFVLMDEAAYTSALAGMREGLGCLTGPPTAAQSALVHRAEALSAFWERDQARGVAALRGMRECDPLLGLSEELAPVGGPLNRWYNEAALLPPSPRAPAAVPEGTSLVVDGRPAAALPTERASVVVLLREREVVYSGLLPGGQALPYVPPAPALEPRARWPLAALGGAGGLVLTAGALGAAGFVARGQVLDAQDALVSGEVPALGATELNQTYRRAQGLFIAAELGAGLALGAGVIGLVGVMRW